MTPTPLTDRALRARVVAVRITPDEHRLWELARSRSPWRSLAHWCREVVADGLLRLPAPERPGTLAAYGEVPADLGDRLAEVCARLNRSARATNTLGRVTPEAVERAELVTAAAAAATAVVAAGRRPPTGAVPPIRLTVPAEAAQQRLVNVRLSTPEHADWTAAAAAAGWTSVGGWTRAFVGGLLGVAVPYPPAASTDATRAAVRELAGAVTNLSQLAAVAQDQDTAATDLLLAAQGHVQGALRELHRRDGGTPRRRSAEPAP